MPKAIMNRKSMIVIVESEALILHLSKYLSDYACEDDHAYEEYLEGDWRSRCTVRVVAASYLLDNNSDWCDEDFGAIDHCQNPLRLWNSIQREISWQREMGYITYEAAMQAIEEVIARPTEGAVVLDDYDLWLLERRLDDDKYSPHDSH